jgi:hypothetical protein
MLRPATTTVEGVVAEALASKEGAWTVASVMERLPPDLLPLEGDKPTLYLHCAHGLHRSGIVAAALILRRMLREGAGASPGTVTAAMVEFVAARRVLGEAAKMDAMHARLLVIATRLSEGEH